MVIKLPPELLAQFFVPFAECDKLRFQFARFLVKHFTPQVSRDDHSRHLNLREWIGDSTVDDRSKVTLELLIKLRRIEIRY